VTDVGVSLATWLTTVRRARLGRTVKAVAFAVGGYASNEGTRVFPGIARLSVECELSPKVVKEALAALRAAGLIALVRAAKRAGDTNEYRLILAEDLLDRIDLPTPTAHELAIKRRSDEIRGKHKLRGTRDTADSDGERSLRGTADTAKLDEDNEPAGYGEDAEQQPAGYGEDDLRGTGNPPNSQGTRQEPNSQDETDLRADLTVPRERCPEHPSMKGGSGPDGSLRCTFCRRKARAPTRPRLEVIQGGAA
jgi:hypothetical protein